MTGFTVTLFFYPGQPSTLTYVPIPGVSENTVHLSHVQQLKAVSLLLPGSLNLSCHLIRLNIQPQDTLGCNLKD